MFKIINRQRKESSVEIRIEKGIEWTEEITVGENDLATVLGSGSVAVFSTPSMIALMERTSLKLVQQYLPEGHTTVGIEVSVKHLRATPPGMKVSCRSKLTGVDGNKLSFELEASDERGRIGVGSHVRYIVETDRFVKKTKEG